MADEWLTTNVVKTSIGAKAAADVETSALEEYATAVRSYVEDRRADLFNEADPPVFDPPAHVVIGAARLAFAAYRGRTDPDKADVPAEVWVLLGIRKGRRFRFGGAEPIVTEAV